MINNRISAVFGSLVLLVGGCQRGPSGPREYQGVLEFEETTLSFELPGRLSELKVKRGDTVKKGEFLALIAHSLEQKLVDARAAEQRAALAQKDLLEVGARPAQIRSLKSVVKAAEANLKQLERQYQREKELFAKNITTEERVEQLETSVAMAVATLEQRKAELLNLELGSRKQEIAGATSRAEALQLQTEAETERLERYSLLAPLDGEVVDVHADPGELVLAGTPVVTVARTSEPYIEVFVPEGALSGISLKTPAKVWMDAEPEPLSGAVTFIARKTEFTPRYLFSETERAKLVVRVRIGLNDPAHKVHAGVPARARFLSGDGK